MSFVDLSRRPRRSKSLRFFTILNINDKTNILFSINNYKNKMQYYNIKYTY